MATIIIMIIGFILFTGLLILALLNWHNICLDGTVFPVVCGIMIGFGLTIILGAFFLMQRSENAKLNVNITQQEKLIGSMETMIKLSYQQGINIPNTVLNSGDNNIKEQYQKALVELREFVSVKAYREYSPFWYWKP
jgi:hypothetical protein